MRIQMIQIQINLRANIMQSLQVKNFIFFYFFIQKMYLADATAQQNSRYITPRTGFNVVFSRVVVFNRIVLLFSTQNHLLLAIFVYLWIRRIQRPISMLNTHCVSMRIRNTDIFSDFSCKAKLDFTPLQ